MRPFALLARAAETGLCYTRRHAFFSEKTVSCGCDGAHLPGVLCADEPDECAERHSDEGAVPVCEYRAEAAEGLPAGVCGDRVRHAEADVSRQIVREVQGTAAADAG